MLKRFTCIVCPNGCEIEAEAEHGALIACKGNRCAKGLQYVLQELTCPMRNIATSIAVKQGELPLVSVRLSGAIPKERIFEVVSSIHALSLTAPILRGQVLVENVLGLGVDVLATRTVKRG